MNKKPVLWIKFSKSLVQQLDYTHMTAHRIPAGTVLSKGGYHVYWVILAINALRRAITPEDQGRYQYGEKMICLQ